MAGRRDKIKTLAIKEKKIEACKLKELGII